MAKKAATNPFFDFDVTNVMANFDPSKALEEFTKMAEQYKIPGVDVDAIIATQQKNVEAITTANKTALEGLQAVAARQAELLQQAMEAASAAVKDLSASGTPQDAAAKQADLVKATYEKTLSDMKEIAEMVAKSNAEAAEAINARITASLEEIKAIALKAK